MYKYLYWVVPSVFNNTYNTILNNIVQEPDMSEEDFIYEKERSDKIKSLLAS